MKKGQSVWQTRSFCAFYKMLEQLDEEAEALNLALKPEQLLGALRSSSSPRP
jgi:hypothetical protein